MSAFVYGAVSRGREEVPAGESKKPPGVGSYVDVLIALVPAEILAVNAVLVSATTDSGEAANGDPLTTITDPNALKLVFWLSIVGSVLLCLIGERAKAKGVAATPAKVRWGRALIPAAAYVAWAMLQESTAFDAVAPDMSQDIRVVIAVFGAIFLAAIAKVVSDKADASEPGEVEPGSESGPTPVTSPTEP